MKNTYLRIGNFVYANPYTGKITVFNNNHILIGWIGVIIYLILCLFVSVYSELKNKRG